MRVLMKHCAVCPVVTVRRFVLARDAHRFAKYVRGWVAP